MRRRGLLRASGALLGGVTTAGCSGGRRTVTRTATAAPVPSGTPTLARDGPVDAAPCEGPTFGPGVRRVVCSGEAPESAPVRLRRSAARFDLPAQATFALTNDAAVPLLVSRDAWRLWKGVDGEWFALTPLSESEPEPLSPGTRHRWRLSLTPRLPADEVRVVGRRGELAVPALGAGRYAFTVEGWFPSEGPTRRTAFQATLDLAGEPLVLEPTDHLLEPTVEGGVARGRVRTGCRSCPDARYVLERAPEATPDRQVIAETAVRGGPLEPLRDALALALEHGVDRVELAGRSPASPPFGIDAYAFEYLPRGITFRVTTHLP